MGSDTFLSPTAFVWLGRDQWRTYENPLVRLFVRLFGPVGMHARIRNAHLIRVLCAESSLVDARILDAGCGYGYTLFWLARRCSRCELHGIDLDPDLIARNRHLAATLGLSHLKFTHGDAGAVSGETYDVIYSIDLLEHIDDDVAALETWYDALVGEGLLVLHLPLRHQLQRRVFPQFRDHTIPDHVRDEYTEDEIGEKLHYVGFQIDRIDYGFGVAGELAFELNYLFWDKVMLRNAAAVATMPLSLLLGYLDTRYPPERGNSFLVVARKR